MMMRHPEASSFEAVRISSFQFILLSFNSFIILPLAPFFKGGN
jgi:hypothetical protein